MNCTYRKHRIYNKYYKIVDGETLMTIDFVSPNRSTRIYLENRVQVLLFLATDETLTREITKEEFDIVLNDAILKMIEISII